MLKINVECPSCKSVYEVLPQQLRTEATCSNCDNVFIIKLHDVVSDLETPFWTQAMQENKFGMDEMGMHFQRIAPSTFRRGRDQGHLQDAPAHATGLSYSFWMLETPVTQQQWSALKSNPSRFIAPEAPVESISWHQAMAYAHDLTFWARRHLLIPHSALFRLPTESEWEWAATSPETQSLLPDFAWFYDNSDASTRSVKEKLAGAKGLYDMLGNVHEWCIDWYERYQDEAFAIDACGSEQGDQKVIRGGCWDSAASRCHAASRIAVPPDLKSNKIGFRLVLVPC